MLPRLELAAVNERGARQRGQHPLSTTAIQVTRDDVLTTSIDCPASTYTHTRTHICTQWQCHGIVMQSGKHLFASHHRLQTKTHHTKRGAALLSLMAQRGRMYQGWQVTPTTLKEEAQTIQLDCKMPIERPRACSTQGQNQPFLHYLSRQRQCHAGHRRLEWEQ